MKNHNLRTRPCPNKNKHIVIEAYKEFDGYVCGCICGDMEVFAATREEAVNLWNTVHCPKDCIYRR